jgi:hypothetical protein
MVVAGAGQVDALMEEADSSAVVVEEHCKVAA